MPNTLWLWVFGLCPRKDFSLSNASRWVALKRQKPYTNSEQPPIYGVGGGLFIATRQPDLICPKWPWVTKELTRVPTVRFQTHTATLIGLQAKLTHPTLHKICSHFLHSKKGFSLSVTSVIWLSSLGPHLTVQWFLWLNKEEKEATNPHSLRAS